MFVSGKSLDGTSPVIGEILLGDYGDGSYYRGVVTSVDLEKQEVGLEFVDFGDKAINSFKKIRLPTEEIMKVICWFYVSHFILYHEL